MDDRKQVKSACQFCGCWIAIVAAVAITSGGLLTMLRRTISPAGPDVVVFIDFLNTRKAMIFSAIVAPFILLLPLGTIKSTARAAVFLVITIGAMLTTAWFAWYRPVAAVAVRGDDVELQYVWPRPSTHLKRSEITSVDYAIGVSSGDAASVLAYSLELRTASRRYFTFEDGNLGDIQRAQKLLDRSR